MKLKEEDLVGVEKNPSGSEKELPGRRQELGRAFFFQQSADLNAISLWLQLSLFSICHINMPYGMENIHPFTYECHDIYLHKTNKNKNYPSIPSENQTSAHV